VFTFASRKRRWPRRNPPSNTGCEKFTANRQLRADVKMLAGTSA
jgi:hypothetical protein